MKACCSTCEVVIMLLGMDWAGLLFAEGRTATSFPDLSQSAWQGTGFQPHCDSGKCELCRGSGIVSRVRPLADGELTVSTLADM